ncbi:MAG: hypothetical protein JWO50_891, partial [Candidatus Kaiserbacteria bacterium]|nr:hypothetical protein [Candidatus Kaiserbacteria bacterium]
LLLIGGEQDEIIPAHLSKKNADAYTDPGSVTTFKEYPGRSHYICGEPGWAEVAAYVAEWLAEQVVTVPGLRAQDVRNAPLTF